jgi:hypothetical protein
MSSHTILTGPLYAISLMASASVALIGLTFLTFGASAGPSIFGIPLFNSPLSLLARTSTSAAESNDAYLSIIGVRDLTLSFVSVLFVLLRDRRGAGVAMAGGIFATVGDGLVMARYSERPLLYIGSHVVTCVPLITLVMVLLKGAGKMEKKML